jgi:hypothetical protein
MYEVIGLATIVWLGAGFISWKKGEWFCYHDINTGGGGMGDGIDCKKCGMSTYDGFNSHLWLFKLLGRVDK